jgi:hypothetical protein
MRLVWVIWAIKTMPGLAVRGRKCRMCAPPKIKSGARIDSGGELKKPPEVKWHSGIGCSEPTRYGSEAPRHMLFAMLKYIDATPRRILIRHELKVTDPPADSNDIGYIM